MTAFLLDTNVLSELTRDIPSPRVIAFLNRHDDLWLSTLLIHEVEYGLRLLPEGGRRDRLAGMLGELIELYGDRIVTLDRPSAEWAAEFRALARLRGRVMDLGDSLVAGIARAHGFVIATRNVADFESSDLQVVNPWLTAGGA